jgi:hypothetical protein
MFGFVAFHFGHEYFALATQPLRTMKDRLKRLWHPEARDCAHLRYNQGEPIPSVLKRSSENAGGLTARAGMHNFMILSSVTGRKIGRLRNDNAPLLTRPHWLVRLKI